MQAITQLSNSHWFAEPSHPSGLMQRSHLFPKPVRLLHFKNLRPISLTSCLGKLFDHVILERLQHHMQTHNLFLHPMISFRGNLSMQDVMIQLSEEVLHPRHAKRTRAILALDLTKAFHNVEHTAVLKALSDVHVGGRTHAYVTDFLRARTVVLTVGELTTNKLQLGIRGTPQGSVLSSLSFP